MLYLQPETHRHISSYVINADDVCVAIVGHTIGLTFLVDEEWNGANLTENAARITGYKGLDSRFLFYYLTSREGQEQLRALTVGSAQGKLPLYNVKSIEVPTPPLTEQCAIARVLGAFDDKIELNRRMNETLDATIRAVFTSWFVDFDAAGINAEGCHAGPIEELLTLSRDTTNPNGFPDESFEHYSIPAFDDGHEPKIHMGSEIKSNKFLVPHNSVLLSKLNPRFPRVWIPSVSNTSRSICSTEFLVAIPREGVSREYLYGLFTSGTFSDVFATLVTGTSSSHQRVKPDYLLAMEVVIPPLEAICRYTEFAKPLHERIAGNLKESRTLASLRDTLIPKLLSGEIRVDTSAA